MARLIPTAEEIATFATPLTVGEKKVLEALRGLDDHWNVVVQPYMNGLRPDFAAWHPEYGIHFVEVKDWNLQHYHWSPDFERGCLNWTVQDGVGNRGNPLCPVLQLKKYKDSLFDYQLAAVGAHKELDKSWYGLVNCHVVFTLPHKVEQFKDSVRDVGCARDENFGRRGDAGHYEFAKIHSVSDLSVNHNWQPPRSHFLAELQCRKRPPTQQKFLSLASTRLALDSLFGYPELGRLDVRRIREITLSKQQRELMPSEVGTRKRVIGSAGSGKSLLLVRKALEAVGHPKGDRKQVLLTCFNITMANYLADVVNKCSRVLFPGEDRHRSIVVQHFHRLFSPPNGEYRGVKPEDWLTGFTLEDDFRPTTVLVDEGQDFEREWVETLLLLNPGKEAKHFMFVEDPRQDTYGKTEARESTPMPFQGRPTRLKESWRVHQKVATLANRFAAYCGLRDADDASHIEAAVGGTLFDNSPPCPIIRLKPVGIAMQSWVYESVGHWISGCQSEGSHPADLALLASHAINPSGYLLQESCVRAQVPCCSTFETREESEKARSLSLEKLGQADCVDPNEVLLKMRKSYKLQFFLGDGRAKVSTVKSFKGWELRHVLLLIPENAPDWNTPEGREHNAEVYTAFTRTYHGLTILCASSSLTPFFEECARNGLVTCSTG